MAQSASVHINGQDIVFLTPLTIAGAVAATATTPIKFLSGMTSLVVQAVFLYGAGGTTTKTFIQTSLDGGASWVDIMSLAFTTSALTKVSQVNAFTAPAAQAFSPTEGTLTDNTIIQGVLGMQLRLKYVTTGTYTGATSLAVYGVAKS